MINRDNYHDVGRYQKYNAQIKQNTAQTVKRKRSRLRHLLEWADETPLSKADTIRPTFPPYLTTVRNDGRSRPLAPSTIKGICETAQGFFHWAKAEHSRRYRSITMNWIESLKFKVPAGFEEPAAYTISQIRKIISLPVRTLTEQRGQAAIAFLFISGARVGACVTFPIKAINLKKYLVRQWPSLGVKTKNRKIATTFLLNIPDLVDVVARWDKLVRTQLAPDALWYATLSRDGMHFTGKTKAGKDRRSAVADDLKLFCDRADIPYLSPHSLRHGHALFALDRATSIAAAKAISQNLMHDSLTTTEKIYGRLNRDNVQRHIASLTCSGQPSSDVSLNTIVKGFPETPEALIDPLADAFARRLSEICNDSIVELTDTITKQLLVEQMEGTS